MTKRRWTDEDLIQAVTEELSMARVMRRLGLKVSGGSYKGLYAHVERLGLNTQHFVGKRGDQSRYCEVEGCDRPAKVKGLCRKHYLAVWSNNNRGSLKRSKTKYISNKTPEERKEATRKYTLQKSQITVELYESQVQKRGNKCDICGGPPDDGIRFFIDHDHACCDSKFSKCGQCIRGLLCGACNRALGGFKDSPAILQNALNYLQRETFWLL